MLSKNRPGFARVTIVTDRRVCLKQNWAFIRRAISSEAGRRLFPLHHPAFGFAVFIPATELSFCADLRANCARDASTSDNSALHDNYPNYTYDGCVKRRAGDLNPIASRTILLCKSSSDTCQLPAALEK